jgi:DNA-binding transcriptional MerR regulator
MMNIIEASEFFQMNSQLIQEYAQQGLLQTCKNANGEIELHDADVQRLTLIRTLLNAGTTIEAIKQLLELWDTGCHQKEQIQILKKQRFKVLDDIHAKQQLLDRIDYIINDIKNEG